MLGNVLHEVPVALVFWAAVPRLGLPRGNYGTVVSNTESCIALGRNNSLGISAC